MQGTRVWSLVQEDSTCCGATEPTLSNYWSPLALGPMCCNYWALMLQLLKPACLEPVLHNNREATTMRSPRTATKSSPPSPQVGKAHAAMKTQCRKKKKKKERKKKIADLHHLDEIKCLDSVFAVRCMGSWVQPRLQNQTNLSSNLDSATYYVTLELFKL